MYALVTAIFEKCVADKNSAGGAVEYITVSGLKAQPQVSDVIGYRLTSLGQRTGNFSCSSELISKMYSVTVNNYRGLTTGGMTVDCPHRERRGYGGDGHTSYQFALANFPVGAYFNKWTRDFADTQGVAGAADTKMPACSTPGACWVPNTAPTVSGGGGPAWSGFVITNVRPFPDHVSIFCLHFVHVLRRLY